MEEVVSLSMSAFNNYSLSNSEYFSTSSATNFMDDTSNDDGTSLKSLEKPDSDCKVCGDKSSGRHYGQYTCEGCKSFFKRSIRNLCVYQCRTKCQCVVDIQRRNHCQFCRLQKCFSVGMRKEAVQLGRCTSTTNSAVDVSETWPRSSINNTNCNLKHNQEQHVATSSSLSLQQGLSWKLLTYVLDWASENIHFVKYLNENDQYVLLKSNWHIILAIIATKCNLELPFSKWVSEKMAYHSAVVLQAMPHIKFIEGQLKKIQSLKLSPNQYDWLQNIVLFNPDVYGLSSNNLVANIQQSIATMISSTETTWIHIQLLLNIRSLSSFNSLLFEEILFSDLIQQGYFINVNQIITKWILYQGHSRIPWTIDSYCSQVTNNVHLAYTSEQHLSYKRSYVQSYADDAPFKL